MQPAKTLGSPGHAQGFIVLLAPMTGSVVPLEQIPDRVFSEGMLGDGIGVTPLAGELFAPCDGVVTHLARTGHAVTISTPEGAEILLHIGIDTFALNGQGFTPRIEAGAKVRTGDLLIEFDRELVARSAPSLVSIIAIANSDAFEIVDRAEQGMLTAGETPLLMLRARGAKAAEASRQAGQAAETACRRITLVHPGGLHARPAARARDAARGLAARLEVHHNGQKAPIESIVGLLGLGAGQGSTIEITANGPQATAAVEAVALELLREVQGEAGQQSAGHRAQKAANTAGASGTQRALRALAGVCAAPGIAVGKLVHWNAQDIAPPEEAQGTPAHENGRLDRALAAVDAELDRDVRNALQRGAAEEAGIFSVHRALLEDPALINAARGLINRAKSAGFAWHEAVRAQASVLASSQDALIAERSADLRDIGKRVLRALGHAGTQGPELLDATVLAAEEFTPSELSSLDRSHVVALAMTRGGATSHAAIIARQIGIPALVALGEALRAVPEGTRVILDATGERLELAPTGQDMERAVAESERLRSVREADRCASQQPAATRDGCAVEVAANIASLGDAKAAVENGADSIGLLRTELLFIHRRTAPTVEEHQQSYQAIVDALQGRAAIIRTLDVGADKEVDYLSLPPEPNPALGLRGIRLAQVRPDLLDDQLRGLLAVRPTGAVRILLPMVTDVGELMELRSRIDGFARDSGREEPIEIGVMVEVPSAALLADQLSQYADFLSIGTNDLTQYTLAMDRCQPGFAARADGLHPAVLRLIAATVKGAATHGRWVGVCGALASDPLAVPLLIGLGVTELSVDPGSVPGTKARLRTLSHSLCRQAAQDALALASPQAVRAMSRALWPPT